MKNIIKYTKLGGIFLGVILITSLTLSILNLLRVGYIITTILSVIIMVLLFFTFGIVEGLNTCKKGYIAGFKIGLLLLIVILLINLLFFRSPFNLSRIIYYLILLFSSVFGAMIGINRKKKE